MHLPIDILALMLKGMLIGIIASAPMGPVGVLCVQRTINKGRWFGLVTGVGACVSDIIYALVTGYGMSFVMDIVNDSQMRFILQIVGGVILLLFGIMAFRSDPTKRVHTSSRKGRGTLVQNGVTAFLVTLSNPLIIFLFIALYAQLAFVVPDRPEVMCLGYASIAGGAMLWWFGLTWLIDKIRTIFNEKGVIIINRIIGTVVIVFSLVALIGTIFNLYSLEIVHPQ